MPKIVTRVEWGARYGRGVDVSAKLPWNEEVYHTEAGAIRPMDWEEIEAYANGVDISSVSEKQWMRNVENYHVNTRGWDGIGYSFCISYDGTIFEGRGWGRSGAHTEGRNSTASGVMFRGHGDKQYATPQQIASAKWLTQEGIRRGHLKPGRRTGSHHEYSKKSKTCCGFLIRKQLGELNPSYRPSTPTPPTGELTMAQAEHLQKQIDDAKAGNNFLFAVLGERVDKLSKAVADGAAGDRMIYKSLRTEIEELEADLKKAQGPKPR